MDFIITLKWLDMRLIHELDNNKNEMKQHLNGIHHTKEIWIPDIVKIPDEFLTFQVHGNGSVILVLRRKSSNLECDDNFNLFPFDKPICSYLIQSSNYISIITTARHQNKYKLKV